MQKSLFQNFCLRFLNLPYIWGGDDPIVGVDCSGLAQEIYAALGLDPSGDQTAQGLHDHFRPKSKALLSATIPQSEDLTGSLVFYGSDLKSISHVAVMIDSLGTMIEAGGGGSSTSSSAIAARQNAYVRLRRWNRRGDCVAILKPFDLKLV